MFNKNEIKKAIALILFACTQMVNANNSVDLVEYSKKHIKIVESGIEPILSFYGTSNIKEKRSLLLCLDKYLDPYYQYNLPYTNQIINWLNSELPKVSNLKLKEDIFQLLQSYSELDYDECELSNAGEVVCETSQSK